MTKINVYKLVFWIYLLIVAAFLFLSCNPVKQVLKDNNKIKQVWEEAVLDSWCVNDSVYVSDTTILLDTLHVLETSTDTLKIDSIIYITKTDFKTVTKTVTIRDTTVITDNSRINLLQKALIKKDGELLEKANRLTERTGELKEMKKDRNKWRLYFFLLLAGFAAWVLRKPIFKLISLIKL